MGKGYDKPNHTQIPNVLLDEQMCEMGEAELRVVFAVARKTFGWHKERDRISLSQLMKLTGLSKQGVLNGTEDAIQRGVLSKIPEGNSFSYALLVNEVDTSERLVNNVDMTGQQSGQANSQPSRHTKETTVKQTIQKKKPLPDGVQLGKNFNPKPKPLTNKMPQDELQDMVSLLDTLTGIDRMADANYGRLAKAAKNLWQMKATDQELEKYFGANGQWFKEDFRGQKGDLPTPENIISKLGAYRRGKPKSDDAKSRLEGRLQRLGSE